MSDTRKIEGGGDYDTSADGPPFGELLSRFFDSHATVVSQVAEFDPYRLIPIIAGLLTLPDWQGSTLRLEVLQHIVVASARGTLSPQTGDLARWLTDLGAGHAGEMEDPSEHLFVSRILSADGDCLILNGIADAPAFHLQNFIRMAESVPRGNSFDRIQRAARALLVLSDAVVKRANLHAFEVVAYAGP